MMKKPDDIEVELNAIRAELYEEIKEMSPSEMTAYMKAQVASINERYGIRAVRGIITGDRRAA
ncbi:MAG: hypothetical protein FWD64_01820 [Acidobacteriaceae bacterium]|nr:hypothetical protein [Acidobacteriaceae bacterium]